VRIAIVGVPRAGKTTLANLLSQVTGYPILHTDDLMDLGWSQVSDEVRARLATEPHLIVEGVAVVRGLRKALAAPGAPVEQCIVLSTPRLPLTHGQRVMARGCATMWRAIEPELRWRGVQVEQRP
jgi:adenylate kinase family enzyme